MAMVTFGGAYAVLAYVAQQAVSTMAGSNPAKCWMAGYGRNDAGATDHGSSVRGFHGCVPRSGHAFTTAGRDLGGLLATWVTFAPCFLWIFLGAPFAEASRRKGPQRCSVGDHRRRCRRHPQPRGLVCCPYAVSRDGPGKDSIAGLRCAQAEQCRRYAWLAISVAAAVAIFRFRVGMIPTLLACSLVGITLYFVGAIRLTGALM